jgi:hypothetical protein
MQISGSQPGGTCPYAHLHNQGRAGVVAPPIRENPPKATGDFSIDEVMCPVLKTGVREGRITVDAEGNATGLNAYLREDLKVGWALRQVFVKGGKSATDRSGAEGDTINLRNLRGSSLDHTADSQILRDGFSQERLNLALSFSADGERLTLADLGKFQQHLLGEEPGLKGKFVGGMEYAAVVSVFGRTDALGQRFISNADFVSLFRDNKFPADWESRVIDTTGLWDVGAAAVEFFRDHPGDPQPRAEAAAKPAGVCPFKHGQQFDLAEAARVHADHLQ